MINRFFLPEDFEKGTTLLAGPEFKHFKVMRLSEREHLTLVNGRHALAEGQIVKIHKDHVEIEILEVQKKEAPTKSVLALSLLKQNHLEIALEKGTEMGITDFWLFSANRSEKRSLSANNLERLQKITVSALKQCGRWDLPKITCFPSMKDLHFEGDLYFGSFKKNALRLARRENVPSLCFIGPEKGFTKEEISFLEMHAKPIIFGQYILRAETAAIAAAAFLSN